LYDLQVNAQLQHHTDDALRQAAALGAQVQQHKQMASEAQTHVNALEVQLEQERARSRELEVRSPSLMVSKVNHLQPLTLFGFVQALISASRVHEQRTASAAATVSTELASLNDRTRALAAENAALQVSSQRILNQIDPLAHSCVCICRSNWTPHIVCALASH
jgi:hypothetical protein